MFFISFSWEFATFNFTIICMADHLPPLDNHLDDHLDNHLENHLHDNHSRSSALVDGGGN